jgi:hypothetical protein
MSKSMKRPSNEAFRAAFWANEGAEIVSVGTRWDPIGALDNGSFWAQSSSHVVGSLFLAQLSFPSQALAFQNHFRLTLLEHRWRNRR